MNYMGARFVAERNRDDPGDARTRQTRAALSRRRHRGAQRRARSGARQRPFLKADLVVDSAPNWARSTRRSAKLEAIAPSAALAVGIASASPVVDERIAAGSRRGSARHRDRALERLCLRPKQQLTPAPIRAIDGPDEKLPYRPCVGMMLINRDGLVFIGRRIGGPDTWTTHAWQMPQGGVDPRRTPARRLRELYEETNVRSVGLLAESRAGRTTTCRARSSARPGTANIAARSRNGTRCASPARRARSTSTIPPGGHEPEFVEWRWEKMERLPELIVPFKRKVYEQVIEEFRQFGR